MHHTNQALNELYQNLLINAPQTVSVEIPPDLYRTDHANRNKTGNRSVRLAHELSFRHECAGDKQS